jgi:hypothetical protein
MFTTIKVAGSDALDTLVSRRELFLQTGEYPFLIGDANEVQRFTDRAVFTSQSTSEIIESSMKLDVDDWIFQRRKEAEEDELPIEETLGVWPGEVSNKGSLSLHTEILSGRPLPEVFLGIASIQEPWQLLAALKYGFWNCCPEPEVHCAFFRKWQFQYGAEIAGISSDVIECMVSNPPRDQATAIALAWEQYWYCADIVDQGCESVCNLAATLLNSSYWYFWWD